MFFKIVLALLCLLIPLPAETNVLKVDDFQKPDLLISDAGSSIGDKVDDGYTFTVKESSQGHCVISMKPKVEKKGLTGYTFMIGAPKGETLSTGAFLNATGYGKKPTDRPMLELIDHGKNKKYGFSGGDFEIREITLVEGTLAQLSVDFTHMEGNSPPIQGEFKFHSSYPGKRYRSGWLPTIIAGCSLFALFLLWRHVKKEAGKD
jgi:hypothetical protein